MRIDLVWAVAGLLAAILAGSGIILWATRWRQQTRRQPDDSEDAVSAYRVLLQRGEISSEEFERICRQLANRPGGPSSSSEPTE